MKKITYINICFILITFLACNGRRMTTQLESISQIANKKPDSALTLLAQLEPQKDDWSKGDRMYYELVKLKAENKMYVTFTTDTIINEVVDYFKTQGTPNERMLAYYLQGRVYADMGEAPQAIQAYYDAIESADGPSARDYQAVAYSLKQPLFAVAGLAVGPVLNGEIGLSEIDCRPSFGLFGDGEFLSKNLLPEELQFLLRLLLELRRCRSFDKDFRDGRDRQSRQSENGSRHYFRH